MQKGKRESGSQPVRALTSILAGGAASFAASLLILAALAAAISSGKLPERWAEVAAVCAVGAGSLAGGGLAALRNGARLFPVAAAAGGVCAVFWLAAGLVMGGELSDLALLRTLCAALGGGCLAGLLCPKPKKRRK